jgi:hypothetical protein
VIRWTGTTAPPISRLDAVVLRYDAQGQLIAPAGPEARDEGGVGAAFAAASDRASFGSGSSAPAEVLPAIRLIAVRYQDHPALKSLNLSPAEWSAFFQAMVKVESNYSQTAVSRAGAIGLAQLMPATARYLGVDAREPLQNLDGGARYLLEQMATFESPTLALAAYNAGPEAVRKYGGVPPFDETRAHIVKVMAAYDRLRADL